MLEIRYDNNALETTDDETMSLHQSFGDTITTAGNNCKCTNKGCEEKHLVAKVGSGGVALHYVCHIEYLDTVNASLPDSLKLFVKS